MGALQGTSAVFLLEKEDADSTGKVLRGSEAVTLFFHSGLAGVDILSRDG